MDISITGIATILLALMWISGPARAQSTRPTIGGEWWTVASKPDLGPYNSPKQQVVDFAIWQAGDGKWQVLSCIRNTNVGGHTRLLFRWEGRKLEEVDWKPVGVAMMSDAKSGEEAGGLQAPFVFREGGVYHLFYGNWNEICHASGEDGKSFDRVQNSDGKSGLFGEGKGANARDPMVLKIADTYHCYYTAHPNHRGADYCRTSRDLKTWSEAKKVAAGGSAGEGPYSAECPFVVARDGGYYLFRTQRYGQDAQSSVYFSKDPMDFGVGGDGSHLVTRLAVAAPEVFEAEGRHYIAALTPQLDGIRVAPLDWVAAAPQ
jgi:hypothetical protein